MNNNNTISPEFRRKCLEKMSVLKLILLIPTILIKIFFANILLLKSIYIIIYISQAMHSKLGLSETPETLEQKCFDKANKKHVSFVWISRDGYY